MSQQSDMAEAIYSRLRKGPIASADLVRELRDRWGSEHGVASVHGFIREVATCLLRREDVEVGDLTEGRFVPWPIPPCDAEQKIDEELMSMDALLKDKSRYVFCKAVGGKTGH